MPHPTSAEISLNPNGCSYSTNCLTGAIVGQVNTFNGLSSPDSVDVVTSVGLPNGTAYTFTYDPTYGTISNIQFPTDGSVSFVWSIRTDTAPTASYSRLSSLVVTQATVTSGSGAASIWSYSFPPYFGSTGLTSTITAPDGSYTTYAGSGIIFEDTFLYTPAGGQTAGKETWKLYSELTYSPDGTLLKSVLTINSAYSGTSPGLQEANGLPTSIVTTLYDGSTPVQQTVNYAYDTYANVIEKDESAFSTCTGTPCTFGATTWLRRTFTNYLWSNPAPGQPNNNYMQAHIVDKASRVLVTDGSGNPMTMTIHLYDEAGHIGSTPTGLSTHDDVNYGAGSILPRGDLATETHCVTISGTGANAVCATAEATMYYYDLTGQLTQRVESPGTSVAESIAYTWGGMENGLLQSVTYPNGASDAYTYWPTGVVKTHTD